MNDRFRGSKRRTTPPPPPQPHRTTTSKLPQPLLQFCRRVAASTTAKIGPPLPELFLTLRDDG
ncbi:hypothetical protein CTI12_AA465200 [Artemisia annua]|uniref:Uncharacterized protein n=1 Tax=Artemisia annua TaxID=35608 RepID=A0A2U1LQX1_ARTAN|nr:hypothetical protein CTI12_AA465200 [Artemisia annua]